MKFIHRLSLLVVVVLASLPLVILAQDNRQPNQTAPQPTKDYDALALTPVKTIDVQPARTATLELLDYGTITPRPTTDYDSLDLTVVPTVDVKPAQSATPELIDYPTATFAVKPAQSATPDLIEYPSDPCKEPPSKDPATALAQIDCPPTATPTRTPVPITVTPGTGIINGLWVLDPNASSYNSSGNCNVPGGDNGGMGGEYQPDDLPKFPVCMTGDQQWLKVDASGPYPLVVPSIYSEQEMRRELLESNGETTGSLNVTITRQYHVISPSEIEYSYITHEEGGCTTTSTVRYKLVEANNLVCSGVVMTPEFTPMPTQIPTAKPGETQLPPATPEPPVQIGDYTIQLPPVDATCKADQIPPSDKVDVSYDSNQNMFISFGGGGFTLFWNGSDYYEYHKGNGFMVSVNTYPGGASLSWSKQGCFVNSQLTRQGQPTATPLPVEPTREAATTGTDLAGSSFSVTWNAPANMCSEANKSMLPDLSSAVMTAQADGNFVVSVEGIDYTLTNDNGIYGFRQINTDGSMLMINMNGFYQGVGAGSITAIGTKGDYCTALLTFTPKG
ncbi:MAG: hypothetical protein GC179_17650 [Anaerolineaceae bacterium]|nr:hypothetical protein [Anaerolineaceae bacterium]